MRRRSFIENSVKIIGTSWLSFLNLGFVGTRMRKPIQRTSSISLTYHGNFNGGGGDSATRTSIPIGSPEPDRLVIAVIGKANGSNTNLNSMTIAGLSATLVADASYTTAYNPVGVYYANVTSGATCSISWTGSGGSDGYVLAVYTLTGQSSSTPVFAGKDSSASTLASITTSSLPSNSVLISGRVTRKNYTTVSWSSNVIEQFTVMSSGQCTSSGAISTNISGVNTITHTLSNAMSAPNNPNFTVVAWS